MNSINLIVSLLIFLFIVVFLYLFQLSKNSNDLEAELKNFDNNSSVNINEILNPVFKSKGLESNSYTIKADKGFQDEPYIRLYNLKAEFEDNDNALFYVSADEGLYNQQNQTIKLSGNVIILDEFKNKIYTEKALIEMIEKKINLLEEVISISKKSSISSNSSVLDETNNTVTYSGNVKVKIENE